MYTNYQPVKKSKTLQELIETPGSIIQIGQKKDLLIRLKMPDWMFYASQKYFNPQTIFEKLDLHDYTPREHDLRIPILPEFFEVYKNFELRSQTKQFCFEKRKNGILSLMNLEDLFSVPNISGNISQYLSKERQNSLISLLNSKQTNYGIEKIQIQENLIWIWKKGKPYKAYYYAMDDRQIIEPYKFNAVLYLSEVVNIK